jgi:hypothetical protein
VVTPEPTKASDSTTPVVTPEPTSGSGGGDTTWWKSIVVNYSKEVQANTNGFIEVTTAATTQCTVIIYYSATSGDDLGGIGAPSAKARRRGFLVLETYTGTAYIELSCWRDFLSGPEHDWKLPMNVTAAAPWTIDVSAPRQAWQGDIVYIEMTAQITGLCTVTLKLPSHAMLTTSTDIGGGEPTRTVHFDIPYDTQLGSAAFTVTCFDGSGVSNTVSGTVQIVAQPTDPPPTPEPATAQPSMTATEAPNSSS